MLPEQQNQTMKVELPLLPRGQHVAWIIQFLTEGLADTTDYTTVEGEESLLKSVATYLQCLSRAVGDDNAFAGLRASYYVPDKLVKAHFHEGATDVQFEVSQESYNVGASKDPGLAAHPVGDPGINDASQPGEHPAP